MKLTKEDKAWSLKVKKLAGFRCQICNKDKTQCRLNSHHIIGRRFKPLKHDVRNGISLCYYDHMHLVHRNTVVGAELIKKAIGTRRYNMLLKKYNNAEFDRLAGIAYKSGRRRYNDKHQ